MTAKDARPFIKWVGGKTQLLPSIGALLPKKIRTYYEVFLGGGAVFFHVTATRKFERAICNDWNAELVNVYKVVRESPGALMDLLSWHMNQPDWNSAGYFLAMRAAKETDPIAAAGRMIYLNKTCFNGLYRVNKSGQFNTPFGRYENPSLFDEENIRRCSEALQNVTLSVGDFSSPVADAGPGDVVYFDPPYVPLSATSNFASYTSNGFSIEDQQRLAGCFKALSEKGVTCLLSNSDTPVVRSLYEGYDIRSVRAKRAINSKATGRGAVGEVIVVHLAPQTEDPYEVFSTPPD
jgi:DNA adenine methylase